MQKNKNTIGSAIKRKFIKPLECGCEYNINKLSNDKKVKHKETINLLEQAHNTLKNVNRNLKDLNLVDANVLLRSAFEYIMMAMLIQFDESIYKEFTMIGIERDKTKICKIIDKFRTHMNEINELAFKDINRQEKSEMLKELYDKMCNFTHSTIIVSTMMEIKSPKEKEVFQLLMYQNYYYLKILLFVCLKYFTNDKIHYLESTNVEFTYLFIWMEINQKIQNYNLDFSKYNDLIYMDRNAEYFEKDKEKLENLKLEIDELNIDNDEFKEKLINFLK